MMKLINSNRKTAKGIFLSIGIVLLSIFFSAVVFFLSLFVANGLQEVNWAAEFESIDELNFAYWGRETGGGTEDTFQSIANRLSQLGRDFPVYKIGNGRFKVIESSSPIEGNDKSASSSENNVRQYVESRGNIYFVDADGNDLLSIKGDKSGNPTKREERLLLSTMINKIYVRPNLVSNRIQINISFAKIDDLSEISKATKSDRIYLLRDIDLFFNYLREDVDGIKIINKIVSKTNGEKKTALSSLLAANNYSYDEIVKMSSNSQLKDVQWNWRYLPPIEQGSLSLDVNQKDLIIDVNDEEIYNTKSEKFHPIKPWIQYTPSILILENLSDIVDDDVISYRYKDFFLAAFKTDEIASSQEMLIGRPNFTQGEADLLAGILDFGLRKKGSGFFLDSYILSKRSSFDQNFSSLGTVSILVAIFPFIVISFYIFIRYRLLLAFLSFINLLFLIGMGVTIMAYFGILVGISTILSLAVVVFVIKRKSEISLFSNFQRMELEIDRNNAVKSEWWKKVWAVGPFIREFVFWILASSALFLFGGWQWRQFSLSLFLIISVYFFIDLFVLRPSVFLIGQFILTFSKNLSSVLRNIVGLRSDENSVFDVSQEKEVGLSWLTNVISKRDGWMVKKKRSFSVLSVAFVTLSLFLFFIFPLNVVPNFQLPPRYVATTYDSSVEEVEQRMKLLEEKIRNDGYEKIFSSLSRGYSFLDRRYMMSLELKENTKNIDAYVQELHEDFVKETAVLGNRGSGGTIKNDLKIIFSSLLRPVMAIMTLLIPFLLFEKGLKRALIFSFLMFFSLLVGVLFIKVFFLPFNQIVAMLFFSSLLLISKNWISEDSKFGRKLIVAKGVKQFVIFGICISFFTIFTKVIFSLSVSLWVLLATFPIVFILMSSASLLSFLFLMEKIPDDLLNRFRKSLIERKKEDAEHDVVGVNI